MKCPECHENEATEEEIRGTRFQGQMYYDSSWSCKPCLAYELQARAADLLKEGVEVTA